ncbi:MAG: hypothetical protein ACTSV5_13290 [Promethearchaeota archaeon]
MKDISISYNLSKDLVKNKFYTGLNLISHKIVDIIKGTIIPNYKGTFTSLNSVLTSVNLKKVISGLIKTNGPPSLVSIESLRKSIIDNLGPYITTTQLDKILFFVDNYKDSIVSYHKGLDLLSIFKDGYRKVLINDLMNSKFTTILQECSSLLILSTLLMGHPDELDSFFYSFHKNKDAIYKRITYLHILRHIKLRVKLWTVSDFDAHSFIDQATLDLLKDEIKDKIDGFISYEKLAEYDGLYNINPKEKKWYDRHWYVQPGYECELEVIRAFYEAVVVFTGDPKTSLKMLAKIKGGGAFIHASHGHHFSIKTFRKMFSTLEKFIKKDTLWRIPSITPKYGFMSRLKLSQRQEKYEKTKDVIKSYMKELHIDYTRHWSRESVKGYHVIKLLKRNLGFDLLSFTELNKASFIRTNSKNKFQRHHFRNNFFTTLLNYVQEYRDFYYTKKPAIGKGWSVGDFGVEFHKSFL